CCSTATGLSLNRHLRGSRNVFVVVRLPGYFRRFVEIKRWRRRRGHPLYPGCAPWISIRNLSVTHGPQEINHGQQISNGKNGGTSGREHIQHLELRRILRISTRHTQISENELREKCEIKADEHKQRRQPAPCLRVHAPRNLRP